MTSRDYSYAMYWTSKPVWRTCLHMDSLIVSTWFLDGKSRFTARSSDTVHDGSQQGKGGGSFPRKSCLGVCQRRLCLECVRLGSLGSRAR